MRLFALFIPIASISQEEYNRLSELVSEDIRVRSAKYRLREDAIRSLAGHLFPRWYSHTQHLPNPTLYTRPIGQPYMLINGENREYSVSHEGNYVLFVTGNISNIGVDICVIPPEGSDMIEGLNDALSPSEKIFLESLSSEEKRKAFALLWTAKEAYTKAIGVGIPFGPSRISVTLSPQLHVESIMVDQIDIRSTGWKFVIGQLAETYYWTTIWLGPSFEMEVEAELVEWSDFISNLR
ncbi:hypothetical protein TREMEDRAFT_42773 [Tremella mesenterica DSM 1558]|uniref:uncharacterized protein n=1 Tax=Tremella mesenterica (strain ATCC 24925 / CBS 8224 / DSM 1558 / NBRC 9311 / NRRL Y-6157 / RJB 2259-6 / UBC 559-6) TaxID=578456 RepID=UPI0003F49ACC|nr:uncharacterized protein TREMEDRAFT_42773 [Tremella mesenterica DSM 1558]EIW71361.1 hypothetical protein TREMEDRAFT_42773 [Tremella mesenterica DSM 1558]